MNTERDQELGQLLLKTPVPGRAPDFVDSLVAQMKVVRRKRLRTARVAVGAAIGICTLAVAVLLGVLPFSEGGGMPPASAAELMLAKMEWGTTTIKTFAGKTESVQRGWDGTEILRGRFAATSGGDLRVDSTLLRDTRQDSETPWRTQTTVICNERLHTTLTVTRKADGSVTATRNEGVWQPLLSAGPLSPFVWQGYAALIRTAIEEGAPKVEVCDTTFDGRSAWKARLKVGTAETGTRVDEIVVDKESGLVVSFTTSGRWASQWWHYVIRITDLKIDSPLLSDAFSLAAPKGVRVDVHRNVGFVRLCTLAEAGKRVGWTPFLASQTSGFGLVAVGTLGDRFGPAAGPIIVGRSFLYNPQPVADNEIQLEYRRGFDTFTVAIGIPVGWFFGPSPQIERLLPGLAKGAGAERVLLRRGPFAGQTASIWFSIQGANLAVNGADHSMWITGDLTRDQIVAVAESLAPATTSVTSSPGVSSSVNP